MDLFSGVARQLATTLELPYPERAEDRARGSSASPGSSKGIVRTCSVLWACREHVRPTLAEIETVFMRLAQYARGERLQVAR